MSDLNSIASGAVSIYQRALATVSNNIANADTEGYTRQELNQAENNTRKYGTSYFGTGAYLAGVTRQYDSFLEKNLRNSYSELNAQSTLETYSNRIVDILGDENVGLMSALDKFFSSAKSLSTDPASNILRNSFLSDSDGLAAQFRNLSSQLSIVEEESANILKEKVNSINTYSKEIAGINRQLNKQSRVADQPPEILDQRDLLLTELSKLVKINVVENERGTVNVSLGNSYSQGIIVNAGKARNLTVDFQKDISSHVFKIDKAAKNEENVASIGGGDLGGILNLRKDVLDTVFKDIDLLAKLVTNEVNQIHNNGLDGYGKRGGDFFSIEPKFSIISSSLQSSVSVTAKISDISNFQYGDIDLQFNESDGQVYNFKLGDGSFADGEKITFSLNGQKAIYTVETGLGSDKSALISSIQRFLKDAFGTQIIVNSGTKSDLNVSSDYLKGFSLSATTNSSTGNFVESNHTGLWTATDKNTNKKIKGLDSLEINGLKINFSGEPVDGENLILTSKNRPSSGMQLLINDPLKVAAASQFRVISNPLNTSESLATVKYNTQEKVPTTIKALNSYVDSNNHIDAAKDVDGKSSIPITHIAAGTKSVKIFLKNNGSDPLDLQIMTRDGRHLLGTTLGDDLIAKAKTQATKENRVLSQEEIDNLNVEAGQDIIRKTGTSSGFVMGSTYSTKYLNGTGDDKYKKQELFYGVRGEQKTKPVYDINNHLLLSKDPVPAELQFGAITPDSNGIIFNSNALELNGVGLKSLTHFGITAGSVTSGFKIDPHSTFFSAGSGKVNIFEEAGVLKYQLEAANILKEGVLSEDTVSGIKTLTFPDVEGKFENIKINFSGTLSDGDTINFATSALTGDDLSNHVLSFFNRQEDISGDSLLSKLGIRANLIDGDKSTAAFDTRIKFTRSLQPKTEQITESGSFSSSTATLNGGNAFNINVTTAGINSIVPISAANTNPSSLIDIFNSYNLGIRATYDYANNKILFKGTSGSGNDFNLSATYDANSDGVDETSVSDLTFPTTSQSALSGTEKNTIPSNILLGIGDNGSSADLTRLGLRTAAYIDNDLGEDLLVFSTGTGTGKLTAEYELSKFDPIEKLRAEPFEIKFSSNSKYSIRDINTNAILAERDYVEGQEIQYQGIRVNLSSNPNQGDRFEVDGDEDGIGNNQNILSVVELETKRFIGGVNGLTISEKYGEALTDSGNASRQAGISKQALTIVNKQALESRDKVSGVSLDQEAADLIRFQQAYQASAKVMQVANQLFDAIIQLQ